MIFLMFYSIKNQEKKKLHCNSFLLFAWSKYLKAHKIEHHEQRKEENSANKG
jgi:hypothetical protein